MNGSNSAAVAAMHALFKKPKKLLLRKPDPTTIDHTITVSTAEQEKLAKQLKDRETARKKAAAAAIICPPGELTTNRRIND